VGFRVAVANLELLRTDRQLLRFVITRSLLTVTAIAPPYVLALAATERGGLGTLGPFVIASALATMLGGRLWGRLSDVSSRRVLIGAAGVSTALFLVAAGTAALAPSIGRNEWVAAGLLFMIVLAYQGVRLGRSTHLVDMADADDRARYTAVSNTVVGVVILVTGAFGALSAALGLGGLFAVFAALSAVAAVAALGLEEVQAA
jgi:MFS family permease